jgi:hypothetical protein
VLLDLLGIVVGLALGAWTGYALGKRFEARRKRLWWVVGFGFVLAGLIDAAGFAVGSSAITLGSVGLMAGFLTGVKYGGFPEVRIWDNTPGSQRGPRP